MISYGIGELVTGNNQIIRKQCFHHQFFLLRLKNKGNQEGHYGSTVDWSECNRNSREMCSLSYSMLIYTLRRAGERVRFEDQRRESG